MALATFGDVRAAFPPTTHPTAAPGTFARCNPIGTIRLRDPQVQTIDGRLWIAAHGYRRGDKVLEPHLCSDRLNFDGHGFLPTEVSYAPQMVKLSPDGGPAARSPR